jgi:hypothetical protein
MSFAQIRDRLSTDERQREESDDGCGLRAARFVAARHPFSLMMVAGVWGD